MRKKIGIIGGLSPESTVSYYLNITRKYIEEFGDCGYPEIIIYSVNLENYHAWREEDRWDKIAANLIEAAQNLKFAGANFCIIATNTMHKVFHDVASRADLPFIHILDPTINEIKKHELNTVGLLGTKFTMSESFYKDMLQANGITAIVPDYAGQEIIHRIIEEELTRGIISPNSREKYIEIINNLISAGAEGIILGCTEIPLLIAPGDCPLPIFDTAILHSDAALRFAVSE
jgi:aspartate racemase